MSIFGKLDAQQIPSNPYFVEKGEYTAEVTKGEYRTRPDGTRQLFFSYTITDEDSAYFDSSVNQFFTLPDADMTAEQFALMPAEDQQKMRRTLSAIKRTLCGNDANQKQRGLGVNPNDLNDENWDPASVVGTKVRIGVNNFGENNQGTNVSWVNLIED